MCKRLYTRNKLHTKTCGIAVQDLYVGFIVCAAHVPEVRFTVDFVQVLGVQLQKIVTGNSHVSYQSFDCVNRVNAVARAIQHHAEPVKGRSFLSACFSCGNAPDGSEHIRLVQVGYVKHIISAREGVFVAAVSHDMPCNVVVATRHCRNFVKLRLHFPICRNKNHKNPLVLHRCRK